MKIYALEILKKNWKKKPHNVLFVNPGGDESLLATRLKPKPPIRAV